MGRAQEKKAASLLFEPFSLFAWAAFHEDVDISRSSLKPLVHAGFHLLSI